MTDPFLTPRQQQVADLVARGFTNKAIAATLHLTERRVENVLVVIAQKIGVDKSRNIRVQIALHFARAA